MRTPAAATLSGVSVPAVWVIPMTKGSVRDSHDGSERVDSGLSKISDGQLRRNEHGQEQKSKEKGCQKFRRILLFELTLYS